MKSYALLTLMALCLTSCTNDRANYTPGMDNKPPSEMVFDRAKWDAKEGDNYLYREKMLNDVVYNDTIRSLDKVELKDLLGTPDYARGDTADSFYYYIISKSNLGSWQTRQQSMVIKILDDGSVGWIKIKD